jgi:hypothetical protein
LDYKDEEQNTLKMATILKSLNSPKRKRVQEKKLEIENRQKKKVAISANDTIRKSSGIIRLDEAAEDDEESVL